MSRRSFLHTNFTAGELSPLLDGRVDVSVYYNGCQRLENMLVLPQGGAKRRTGLRFVAEVKDSSKKVRLIAFEFNTEQTYILEFGHQYIRFYRNQGQIFSGPSAYEIASPYDQADLDILQFAQSNDVMWIVHPGYKPRKLGRTGHTSWTLTNYAPTGDPFTSAGNYPSTVTFHEQRLWFAASTNDPQKIWATKSGDFENMTTGTQADDALEYVIASNNANVIRWLESVDILLVGTSGGEFVARASSVAEAITPNNIQINKQTNYGSANVRPAIVENILMFLQRSAKKLRAYQFSFDRDSFVGRDATILSNTITNTGLKELSYHREPESILFGVGKDGELKGLTLEEEQRVQGWHRQVTKGSIESIATIPVEGGEETWVLVQRAINGQTKRYVEFLTAEQDTQKDWFYIDSGLSYDGAPVTTISGLDHLEGEAVAILADGAVHPQKTVSSNQVMLDFAASTIHVGLPYRSILQTMKLEAGGDNGPALGKKKNVHSALIKFFNTLGAKIGARLSHLQIVAFRDFSDNMDDAPPPFTGIKEVHPAGGWTTDGDLYVVQDDPMPMTILGISLGFTTNDG